MTLPTPDAEASLPASKPDSAARRTRMRDFQTRLVERMQAARGGSDERAGQLGVLIGERRWLFDLQQAGEIVAPGVITSVPLTQPWFLGLTNIRGNLISVVDFAHFLGGAPTVIDKQCRIIAFAPGLAFNGGLLVSRVLGLRNVADMERYVDGQADEAASGRQASRFMDRERQLWQVLDLSALTQDSQFLHVGV